LIATCTSRSEGLDRRLLLKTALDQFNATSGCLDPLRDFHRLTDLHIDSDGVTGTVEGVVPALVIVEALEGRDAVAVDRPAVDDLELHLLAVTGSGGVDEHHADDPVRTHHQFVQLRPPGVSEPA
jgi:hypothetical protein